MQRYQEQEWPMTPSDVLRMRFTNLNINGSAAAAGTASDSQTGADVKTAADNRVLDPKSSEHLNAEIRLQATFDRETEQLVGSQCCTAPQTAQLWHYMQSSICPEACEIPDDDSNPNDIKWGGWSQTRFLLLYIRTLLETVKKIKSGQDQLLSRTDLPRLKDELSLAVSTYRSTQDRAALEKARLALLNSKAIYDKIIAERTQVEAYYNKLHDELNMAQQHIEDRQLIHVQQCYDARDNAFRKVQAQLLKFEQLNRQVAATQADYEKAQAAFTALQEKCARNLFENVRALSSKNYKHFCHAAGFIGHAIYFDFEDIGDKIRVRICNLGGGCNKETHYSVTQFGSELFLPQVLEFNKDAAGSKSLYEYCSFITQALTENAAQGINLIYRSKVAHQLGHAQTELLFRQNQLQADFTQTTGNCTFKGFAQGLRERNPVLYRDLFLSLFTWSKNGYFIRKYQETQRPENLPKGHRTLVTRADIAFLQRSQAAFLGTTENEISALVAQRLPGLKFPTFVATPQPAPAPTRGHLLKFSGGATDTTVEDSYRVSSPRSRRLYCRLPRPSGKGAY